ncbi:MAG: hypothetical protein LW884_01085 [Bacteroidetes bacterium]|jgi:hypothetical protein|nr:hypothetical protein [Bacteroidota bacterium]
MHHLIVLLTLLRCAYAGGVPSVDLGSFVAEVVDDQVVCSWMTTEEKLQGHFYIQQSENGYLWETIGRVEAKGPAQSKQYYHFSHVGNHRLPYYRLVFQSLSGLQDILATEKVDFYAHIQFHTAELDRETGVFHLGYLIDKNKRLLIRLYDKIGQQVYTDHLPSGSAGTYAYDLNLRRLGRGSFLLVVTQEEYNLNVAEYRFTY